MNNIEFFNFGKGQKEDSSRIVHDTLLALEDKKKIIGPKELSKIIKPEIKQAIINAEFVTRELSPILINFFSRYPIEKTRFDSDLNKRLEDKKTPGFPILRLG